MLGEIARMCCDSYDDWRKIGANPSANECRRNMKIESAFVHDVQHDIDLLSLT